MRYTRGLEIVTVAILILILGSTAYEAAIALRWIPIGDVPGEDAPYQGPMLLAAAVGILAGVFVALPSSGRNRLRVLLAPAAAAFMVARFYTFDPYYAPTLRRASDGGVFSPVWVYALAALAVLAGILAHSRPRLGFVSASVMLVCLFTGFFVDVGH